MFLTVFFAVVVPYRSEDSVVMLTDDDTVDNLRRRLPKYPVPVTMSLHPHLCDQNLLLVFVIPKQFDG